MNKKSTLMICASAFTFLAVEAIPKQSTGNVPPDRSKVFALSSTNGAEKYTTGGPEVLYTLLLP